MSTRPARLTMVEQQLARRGISDRNVLDAFLKVPRESFMPAELAARAYEDAALPIASGQTISQPYIVAFTAEAMQLEGHERVLEIGTGSGYAAAIFAQLVREVFTVERLAPLARTARARLARLGYDNVAVRCGDGTLGWPEQAPFHAIAVAAGGPDIPIALKQQLAIGGRLVIPVGQNENEQVLTRVTRVSATSFRTEPLLPVRFVPLMGAHGWRAGDPGPTRARLASPLQRNQSEEAHMNARVTSIGMVGSRVELGGHALLFDQPAAVPGGQDRGPSPLDVMVVSVAACAHYYAAAYLHGRGLDPSRLTVDVESSKDRAPVARIGRLTLRVRVPPGLSEAQLAGIERAIKNCPAYGTLLHPPEVEIDVEPGEAPVDVKSA